MPKFYCVHYTEKARIPKMTAEQKAGLKKAIGEASAKMPAVKFNSVMWDPNTGIGFADIDAPNAQAAQDFLKAINAPPNDMLLPVEPLVL
jgi:hypothetical protein